MSVSSNLTVITNAGEAAAITAGENGALINITGFQIGSDLITPSPTMTGVSTLVYTGTTSQISYAANSSTNTMTFFITLDQSVGNFTVGNIGLFLSGGAMFTISALENADIKTATNSSAVPPVTGNLKSYAIPIALTNIQNIINLSVLTAAYDSLPSVATEAQLPALNASPYNTYLVNTFSKTNTSSIAVNNGSNWIQMYGIFNNSDSAFVYPNLSAYNFAEGDAVAWNGTSLVLWDPSSTNTYAGIVGKNDLLYRSGVFTISSGTPYTLYNTYYVGTGSNAGILTSTPPLSSAFYYQVGFAITTSSLLLNPLCTTQLSLPGRLLNIQVFNSSGTYTPTFGTNSLIVEVVGAGGGSGGCQTCSANQNAVAGGGQGGAFARVFYQSSFGTSQSITIGSGGSPGNSGFNPGGDGSSSGFGGLVVAPGGRGGFGGAASATSIGSILNGSKTYSTLCSISAATDILVNTSGSPATLGYSFNLIQGGTGGSSPYGNQTAGSYAYGSGQINVAISGAFPGCGATGGSLNTSCAAIAGATGANGQVVVYEYS